MQRRWVGLFGLVVIAVVTIGWGQGRQVPLMVSIAEIHQRANELLNQTVMFLGIQQAYYERGEIHFTELGIPASVIPSHLRGDNLLGLIVRDFSGEQSSIFAICDRKRVHPPEAAHNPPPSSFWLIIGQVRRLRNITFIEVAELGREPAWRGYRMLQLRHWFELLIVLIALALLNSVFFLAFFNLTERPSSSVRVAYLLCLWALVAYLLFREPFSHFFTVGTIGFWVLIAIAGVITLLLLLSLLLRGS